MATRKKKKDYTGEILAGVLVGGTILAAIVFRKAPSAGPPDQKKEDFDCPPKTVRVGDKCLPVVIGTTPPVVVVPPVTQTNPPSTTVPPVVVIKKPPVVVEQPPKDPVLPCPPPNKMNEFGECVAPEPTEGACPEGQTKDLAGFCVPASKAVLRSGDKVLFVFTGDGGSIGTAFASAATPKGLTPFLLHQTLDMSRQDVIDASALIDYDVAVVFHEGLAEDTHREVWKRGGVFMPSVDVYRTKQEVTANAPYYTTQREAGFDQMAYALEAVVPPLGITTSIVKMVDDLTNPAGPPPGSVA